MRRSGYRLIISARPSLASLARRISSSGSGPVTMGVGGDLPSGVGADRERAQSPPFAPQRDREVGLPELPRAEVGEEIDLHHSSANALAQVTRLPPPLRP